MMDGKRLQISGLVLMAILAVGLGIWLLRAGYTALGCVWVGVFLWRAQQFSFWLIVRKRHPLTIWTSV